MLQRPPGPEPHFLIGNIPLAGWVKDYGDISYYRA